MECGIEWIDVCWHAECDCVISCAYSLTYDFHIGRVDWNITDLDTRIK